MMIGIDAGSRRVKIVQGTPADWSPVASIDTATFYREYCAPQEDGNLFLLREKLGLAGDAGSLGALPLVATGYGRNSTALAEARQVNEILAHIAGTTLSTGLSDYTLLDIGGQDTKIAVVRDGQLEDIETNDRCAASCGRFLENASSMLGCSLDELAAAWQDPEPLSSTCAIFAESEIIERLAAGVPVSRICAGINLAVFRRIEPMLRRVGGETIVFSGGVARSGALRELVSSHLNVNVVVIDDPEFMGALGCLALAD